MNRNVAALFGTLMLLTACQEGGSNAAQSELAKQGRESSAAGEAGAEKKAGVIAAVAAIPQADTLTRRAGSDSVTQLAGAASAEDDPMEEQRCVWRCLADANGASDPAYERCVVAQCGGGKGEGNGGAARADLAPAGNSWLIGSWAPDGLCAEDTAITYRSNGTYVARSPGGDGDEGHETGSWKLTGARLSWTATGGNGLKVGQTASATVTHRGDELIIRNMRGETTAVWSFSDQGSTPTEQRRCD